MKRDLKRVYKHHGIKYFAFPAIVILLLAALANQWLGGYMENREEAADLELRLDNNRNIFELHKMVQRNNVELSPVFTPLQQQFFVAPDITQSVNVMQEKVRNILQTLYFDNLEFSEFSDYAQGTVSHIAMTVRFTGVPQQLPRLQAALARSSTTLAIDKLEIKVVDDPQRGGRQLAMTARFAGLHIKPLPEPTSASTSMKTQVKP